MQPISICKASSIAVNFFASVVPASKCWTNIFIIPIVCSIAKLNNPIPPNALCMVCHSLFTLRLMPRDKSSRKFCFFNTSVAVDRGIASTARPYLTMAHSLKQYAIQPSFAGRWPFFILFIHFSTRSVALCCICALSLPSMLD